MFLEGERPYVTCAAGPTKNKRDARQYVQPELAAELRAHVATKAPAAPVFAMPPKEDVAAMLRADLGAARREGLKAARHERAQREQGDFLAAVNHEGEHFDFHALRHTCGAWLAMAGAHPKAVQAVMRHSTITLTMDCYGHLFPGQEAETVARLPAMLADAPEALRATGTDDPVARPGQEPQPGAQRRVQQLGRETLREPREALRNDGDETPDDPGGGPRPKPLPDADLGDIFPAVAVHCEQRRARDSNPQPLTGHLISSQHQNSQKQGVSATGAHLGAHLKRKRAQPTPTSPGFSPPGRTCLRTLDTASSL